MLSTVKGVILGWDFREGVKDVEYRMSHNSFGWVLWKGIGEPLSGLIKICI